MIVLIFAIPLLSLLLLGAFALDEWEEEKRKAKEEEQQRRDRATILKNFRKTP